MSTLPHISFTNIFNPADFGIASDSITTAEADLRYLKLSGGALSGALTVSGLLTGTASVAISGASSKLTIANVTASTSSSTGAFQCAGGAYFGANSKVSGTLDVTALTIGGVSTDLSTISGVTAGTAAASKALILDSSKNIAGINTMQISSSVAVSGPTQAYKSPLCVLNTVNASGEYLGVSFINSLNSNQNPLAQINLNRVGTVGGQLVFHTSDYTTGADYESMRIGNAGISTNSVSLVSGSVLNLYSAVTVTDTSVVGDKLLNVLSGTACDMRFGRALSSKDCYTMSYNHVGTGNDGNNVHFDAYGSSNTLVLRADKRVVFNGTNANSAIVNIFGSVSTTFSGPNATYGRLLNNSVTVSNAWNLTDNIGLYVEYTVAAAAYYALSDRRVKQNIAPLAEGFCDKLYEIEAVSFEYKASPDKRCIGFIAQDVLKSGFREILTLVRNDDLQVEGEYDVDGHQMMVNYDQVAVINQMMIKRLIKRNTDLEAKIGSSESKNVVLMECIKGLLARVESLEAAGRTDSEDEFKPVQPVVIRRR